MIIAFLIVLLLAIAVAWFKGVYVTEGKKAKLFTLRLCNDLWSYCSCMSCTFHTVFLYSTM